MKNCPGCGASVSEEAAFCEYCGVAVKKRFDSERMRPDSNAVNADGEEGRMPRAPGKARLKKVSMPVMLTLTFLTFMLYPPIWLFLRRNTFSSMSERTRLHPIFPALFLGAGMALAAFLNGDAFFGEHLTPEALDSATSYALMAYFALSLVITFTLRRILREYASRNDTSSIAANLVARSEVFAFLFQILYIQHHINLLIEAGIIETPD